MVLVLCNLLLVLCAMVELRAWAFGHGHCGVCLQLGLALLVEAVIGGTTIAWVSMSTTLHMQTHRARIYSHTHPSCPAPQPQPHPKPHLTRRTCGFRSAATPPPVRRRATREIPRCSEGCCPTGGLPAIQSRESFVHE
mgnify:FL=1